jgi:hydroxymethylpyrimidine/phosphomethylpyrimidine kinase
VVPKAFTIAGSDPSGGAGVQADLKTFSALRVYGMAVIAALTAQSTVGVASVMPVPAEVLKGQLDTVLSDIQPDATKTGMLSTAANVELVAAKVREYGLTKLVVDPVMLSTSGALLLEPDAQLLFRKELLPLALLITPNLDEARALTGRPVSTVDDMEEAALQIHSMGARNVLVKGGHLEGDSTDVFFDGKQFFQLRSERIHNRHTHGTGCVFSAAITAYLALGKDLEAAVREGKQFVTAAIRGGLALGRGNGPCDPLGLER